jgi:twinfilin
LKHLTSQQAPAPLTHREEELEIIRQSENLTRINVDTKHKSMQGILFPIDPTASVQILALNQGHIDYVQLSIDIKNEKILLDKYEKHLSINDLASSIPTDKGRFHLYRFVHDYNGEACAPIVFIYSMPGFGCSIKERMLYSSCKSEIIQYLKGEANIYIVKTFEVSEPSEITEQALLDEIHPKKQETGLKFEKPKGPTSRGPRRVTKHVDHN